MLWRNDPRPFRLSPSNPASVLRKPTSILLVVLSKTSLSSLPIVPFEIGHLNPFESSHTEPSNPATVSAHIFMIVGVDDGYFLPKLPGEEKDFWEGEQWDWLGFLVEYLWAFGIVFSCSWSKLSNWLGGRGSLLC
uniref:Uncharacterized protein n=1 Tax=Cannabis sativa TaxID=3483 RepID=A0A803PKI5_CANSA